MRSIRDITEKIKGFRGFQTSNFKTIPDDLFLALIIILVALGSFGLGRLSKIEGAKTPIQIENAPEVSANTFNPATPAKTGNSQAASIINSQPSQLVGSKNGKKYYYAWCAGAQKILPANLVHFASKEEAEARGYTSSTTCKGL